MPKQTLLELSRDEAALRETDLFRTYVIHHASGLHILASPPSPTFSALISTEQVEAALARALDAYEVVVVDAGTAVDQRLTTLFSLSETVVVPVMPEIPALNAMHSLLDQLAESRAIGAHTLFVLNHVFERDLLKRADVETALGSKISADLPYDPMVYLKAVNEGVPVVRGAQRSPARTSSARSPRRCSAPGSSGARRRRPSRSGGGSSAAARPPRGAPPRTGSGRGRRCEASPAGSSAAASARASAIRG